MIILGDKVALYIKSGSDYIPLICGRNCELNIQSEMMEITTASSTNMRQFIPQYSAWTLSFEGIANIQTIYYDNAPVSPSYSVDDLINMQIARTPLIARIKAEKGNGGYLIYEGSAYLQSNTFSSPNNAASTFSVTMQGSGDLTVSDEVTSNFPYAFHYGYNDTGAIPSFDDIVAASSVTVLPRNIPVVTFGNSTPKYLWVASPVSQHTPVRFDDGTNHGPIPGSLFNAAVAVSTFRVIMSKVPFKMAGATQFI